MNTKTPWTPGPWTWAEYEHGYCIVMAGPETKEHCVAQGFIGAGNARLISLAPDMAELLRAIVNSEETLMDGGAILSPELETTARALLAKLEGGQE